MVDGEDAAAAVCCRRFDVSCVAPRRPAGHGQKRVLVTVSFVDPYESGCSAFDESRPPC